MQHHGGLRAQVVKHGGGVVKKQRQVVLNARSGHACAHVFVNAALGRVAFQQLTPAVAKLGARGLVHGELASGQQAHVGHRVEAALAVGVKGTNTVDLVVKQIHPKRHQRAHGEQVNQTSAHRIFPWADHLGHVAVARQRELRLELGLIELLPYLELVCVGRQKRGRCQPVQRGGGGHEHHIGTLLLVALADAPQCGQPFADQVLVRRKRVVGQGFPVRKHGAAQLRRKEHHFVHQALCVGRVGGNDGGHAPCSLVPLGQPRQQHGVGRADRARQRESFTRGKSRKGHGVLQIQKPPAARRGGVQGVKHEKQG